MNTITIFITIAGIAWCLQILLGWWQLHRFNKMFLELKKTTYLGVGRSESARFNPKPRVIMALAIDQDKTIVDSLLMAGLTVFAAPQKITELHGMSINTIDPSKIFPNNPSYQSALSSALKTG